MLYEYNIRNLASVLGHVLFCRGYLAAVQEYFSLLRYILIDCVCIMNTRKNLIRTCMFTTGVTVPTLHVGMLYTASCWSTDIHHLPYVQYLHGEADIVWWDIPDIHLVPKAVSYSSDDMYIINWLSLVNAGVNVLLQVFCPISRRGQV